MVYSTLVHARIPNGQPRENPREKSARVGRVGGQVGEDCRACPARGKLNAPRQADFRARRTRRLPREDARAEVGEAKMSVSVSVP